MEVNKKHGESWSPPSTLKAKIARRLSVISYRLSMFALQPRNSFNLCLSLRRASVLISSNQEDSTAQLLLFSLS